MKDRCAELCEVILPTISAPELIWRWPRTLRSRELWRSRNAGASSRFLSLEDSITDTNATPLRGLGIVGPRRCSFRSSCRPKQYPRGPTPDSFLNAASQMRTPLYCLAEVPQQGCRHADKVFGNHSTEIAILQHSAIIDGNQMENHPGTITNKGTRLAQLPRFGSVWDCKVTLN
jgi:hypothetical protein